MMLGKRTKLLAAMSLVVFAFGVLVACRISERTGGWVATDLPTPEPMQINMRIVAIEAARSGRTSRAIMEDGSLWLWGGYSQHLGGLFRPINIGERRDVLAVSDGFNHTALIVSDGALLVSGDNRRGQLGNGRTTTPSNSAEIMNDVIAVTAAGDRTFAITSDNALWAWGDNSEGILGDGTTEDRRSPVKIMEDVIAVSAGSRSTMVITSDNVLWGLGIGSVVLDNITSENTHSSSHIVVDVSIDKIYTPARIMDDVIAVSVSGNNRVMVITSDNILWSWNKGNEFRRIMDDATAVSVGLYHAAAIKSDGTLWTWGRNNVDQSGGMLGNGTFDGSREPIQIMEDVVTVAAGRDYTLAITSDGNLWAWGANTAGQLGIGTERGEYEQRPYRGETPSVWLSPILVLEYVPEG